MKRFLAILALMSVVLVWPMAVLADASEEAPPGDAQEIELPANDQRDDVEQDAQGTSGDPHELGGGFRGADSPCGTVPVLPWVGPVATLIMQLV